MYTFFNEHVAKWTLNCVLKNSNNKFQVIVQN